MVVQFRRIRAIGRPADQYEAPVAIAAIDIARLVDLQEHARVPERRATGNVARPITGDAGMGCADEFGGRLHGPRDSKRRAAKQSSAQQSRENEGANAQGGVDCCDGAAQR